MTINNQPQRISRTQDSISKQGAVDSATEIALNPVWRKATQEERTQILGDIQALGKLLYFEKNLLPTTEDYKKLYQITEKENKK